jgi:hypothetical protein
MLQYHDNTKTYIKMLERKHGAIAIVGSHTVNEAAEQIIKDYYKKLEKNFIIRNKYTKNSIKLYKSNPVRKSGEFRKLTSINTKIKIRKMKGGKDHYLKLQEEGGIKKGTTLTLNKVAYPNLRSRTSNNLYKPIGGRYRIYSQLFDQPNVGGKKFGYNDKFSPHQRYAIGQKYAPPSKMFIMKTTYGLSIFAKQHGQIQQVRDLKRTTIKIKATHYLEKSMKNFDSNKMDRLFIKNTKKYLGQ